ncbi:restriction endonuclease [candidate division KSB1 bacterium]|nr:restriction endonuclease [candidate division KSB1 bacterium]
MQFERLHLTATEAVPASESTFVGRAKELGILEKSLLSDTIQVVIVTGRVGIGKTSLVHQFWRMHETDFPGGIEVTYAHWGAVLDDLPKTRKLDTTKRSLLVLEEAHFLKPKAFDQLNHELSANINLNCIIVSQTQLPVQMLGSVNVRLEGFSHTEWDELLRKRLALINEDSAKKYFNYVKGHPLFLSLGASTIREGLLSWNELIRDLQPFREPGIIGPDGVPYDPSIALPKPIVEVSEYLEERLYREVTKNPELMYTLSPRDFERLVAELLNKLGYEITLTPPAKDGGVDIYAARSDEIGRFLFLVECKRYAKTNKVQVDVVRSLYGIVQLEKATAGIIATTSSFTRGAKEFQQEVKHQMQLRDYISLNQWINDLKT